MVGQLGSVGSGLGSELRLWLEFRVEDRVSVRVLVIVG